MADNPLYQFYDDITIYVYYKIDIDTFFNELKNVEMTNLLASIPNDKVKNNNNLTFQKNDTTRVYFSQTQINKLYMDGKVNVFADTIFLHDLTAQQHFPIDKYIWQKNQHDAPTNANDIYKQKAARFLFTWKYLKNKRYANLNIDIQHAFAFASIDTTYVDTYLKEKTPTTIQPITLFNKKETDKEKSDKERIKNKLINYLKNNDVAKDTKMIKVKNELNTNGMNIDDFLKLLTDEEKQGLVKNINETIETFLQQASNDDTQGGIFRALTNKIFSNTKTEKPNQLLPTTWSWEVTEDIQVVIKYICTNNDGLEELAWKYGDAYVRVREIKERMLRIPLVGMPTKCRLKDEGVNDKKIYTFCCLLLLAESYGVPLIRVADWEIVNKTWMMMLHQYRNITNEDGYWLVKKLPQKISQEDVKRMLGEEVQGQRKKDIQVIFHGGRLLELVVRMYNLRVTQDDNNALKLFKYGVNNYRMYLEKYMEKMQPFMAPIEVSERDHIVDVLIKQGWSHPKRVVEDVIEPFCKNVSILFGFDDRFKIVYNDYFDS